MTKQEIIEETVEYYRNNPFGFNSDTRSCIYKGAEGQMCAVGRCLIDAEQFGEEPLNADMLNPDGSLDELLKEQYKGHDIDFWTSLQVFHDSCARGLFELEDYKNYWSLREYYES